MPSERILHSLFWLLVFLNRKPAYKYCCPAPLEIIEKWKWPQLQNSNHPTAGGPAAQVDRGGSRLEWQGGLAGCEPPPGGSRAEPWHPPIPFNGAPEQRQQDLHARSGGRHLRSVSASVLLRDYSGPAPVTQELPWKPDANSPSVLLPVVTFPQQHGLFLEASKSLQLPRPWL